MIASDGWGNWREKDLKGIEVLSQTCLEELGEI
jgi:hypothetical protein